MDFRPGDYRVVEPREQGFGGWVLIGLGVALIAGSVWLYQFRPYWLGYVYHRVSLSRTVISEQDLATLYQRYGMAPLDTNVVGDSRVNALLADLQKEACARRIVLRASVALEDLGATRGAADLLKGFADACPEGNGERYRASELYYQLGDYDIAVKLSSDLINSKPDWLKPYLIRAKSEQGSKRYEAAIEDYATLIRLWSDTTAVLSEIFMRMSDSYEQIDQPCEAIGPIQTYIALDSEKRATTPLLKRIAELAAKGNCAQIYAKGFARIPRRSNGVSIAKAEINGVPGTFIVDTGASFVTLAPGFARLAKPRTLVQTESLQIQTANGTTSATLATVDNIKLDGVSASSVPAVVASKSLGDGVDGLLGMSFLSRFSVAIQDREIQLKAKTLGE